MAELAREPRRVLVIEDHGDSREALRILLERNGHHVFTAATGLEGVALAESSMPDVVLVDIGLPELDGYEVARRVRASTDRRFTLVALTGYASETDRARAKRAGFDAYLVKPVDIDQLGALILAGAVPGGNS